MKSDVYFIETKENDKQSRISRLAKLLSVVDPLLSYKSDEFIPVKFTIGDSRCVYNVGPELVKPVISLLKKKKTKPFLFDTNVIYKGERQNAIDHLTLAQNKGFGYTHAGAPYIIADGVFGQDGREYDIGSRHIKKIKVPSFVGFLDSLFVLSHATGHIISGYAGAIKNVAMGMCCRPTKLTQHSSLKPHIIKDKCVACGACLQICPAGAITLVKGKASINQDACLGCGECLCVCGTDAIFIHWQEEDDIFAMRLVETAKFILSKFKQKFFINFAFDITMDCDCISDKSDKMASPDIGILASSDILAIDKANIDLIRWISPSFLKERPQGVYTKMLEYAEEKNLGGAEYNLIKL